MLSVNIDVILNTLSLPIIPKDLYIISVFEPLTRGTQQEHSSKPLKHSIVERILVFKR